VVALFALLKLDAGRLWLLLPDVDPAVLAPQLQRFVFRSKVALAVRDDLHVSGTFSAPAQAVGATLAEMPGAGFELDLGGEGGARHARVSAVASIRDESALARWTAMDLEHGLPRLPASQAEQWTPQMLSLERLSAFSVRKGCYPGQEIVARTHFLGQAKRGLALFESRSPIALGARIDGNGMAMGEVVSVAGSLALAIVPSQRPDTPVTNAGQVLAERTLRAGVARLDCGARGARSRLRANPATTTVASSNTPQSVKRRQSRGAAASR
jgi:folate-binding protein YgfZ